MSDDPGQILSNKKRGGIFSASFPVLLSPGFFWFYYILSWSAFFSLAENIAAVFHPVALLL